MTSSSSSSSSSESSPQPFRNHLLPIEKLNNTYFALRHGQSMANVQGIIASDPSVACLDYGLSPVGQEQARKAGKDLVDRYLKEQKSNVRGVAVVSSDLLRAKETAQHVADAIVTAGVPTNSTTNNSDNTAIVIDLYGDGVIFDTRLRERYFGDWDWKDDTHYDDVWNDDVTNPYHTHGDVESVWSVTDRATEFVRDWDSKLSGYWIVCVAHGDVLQILQTAFTRSMDPSQHRSLQHLETATLRPLELGPTKK
jgi:probable phosphoglycerate mutase